MKVKLVRKQKYIIETHQEIEVDVNDLLKYNDDLEELDELFYDTPETILSGDEKIAFNHPDNFDYIGNDILIWDERDINVTEDYPVFSMFYLNKVYGPGLLLSQKLKHPSVRTLFNRDLQLMEYNINKYGSVNEASNFISQYVRLYSYKNQLLDDLQNWEDVNIISIKEYIRDKKIEKLLNK